MDSSCGVKKVVGCKIDSNGCLLYKVKWEATWEHSGTLASCQHLIDEFWSFVDRADTERELGAELRAKGSRFNSLNNLVGNEPSLAYNLSDAQKLEIESLIDKTSRTMSSVEPPSFKLSNSLPTKQQKVEAGHLSIQDLSKEKDALHFYKTDITVSKCVDRPCDSTSSPSKGSLAHGLQYIESFTNQYVKIILVCKFCNKEQSLKFSQQWRQHYLDAHAPDEEKPHKCSICGTAFARSDSLKRHMKKHSDLTSESLSPDIF